MKKYWDSVEIGHKLKVAPKKPITRLQIARFAAACDDFSPMGLDEEYAKSAGLGSVYAPGIIALGIIEEGLKTFAQNMSITTLSTTFQRLIWPCDVLSAKGVIVRRYRKNDEHRVQFSVWVENQNGDVVVKGQAICLLFKNAQEESHLGSEKEPQLSQASYAELVKRCEQVTNRRPAQKTTKVPQKEIA
ncbi:MAG: MaoC family dehydratase N-terminal domain-containing protein [Myxococcales bacterium]|nr:MaoC family dehydratase N-terminal domain-containing protein [Myxococcales bacterium]USN51488.1 MAG: MaoC family dehydratase N-terminal domain-containing protein [Myxococcales bacterium]